MSRRGGRGGDLNNESALIQGNGLLFLSTKARRMGLVRCDQVGGVVSSLRKGGVVVESSRPSREGRRRVARLGPPPQRRSRAPTSGRSSSNLDPTTHPCHQPNPIAPPKPTPHAEGQVHRQVKEGDRARDEGEEQETARRPEPDDRGLEREAHRDQGGWTGQHPSPVRAKLHLNRRRALFQDKIYIPDYVDHEDPIELKPGTFIAVEPGELVTGPSHTTRKLRIEKAQKDDPWFMLIKQIVSIKSVLPGSIACGAGRRAREHEGPQWRRWNEADRANWALCRRRRFNPERIRREDSKASSFSAYGCEYGRSP